MRSLNPFTPMRTPVLAACKGLFRVAAIGVILWGAFPGDLTGQEAFHRWGRLANPGFEGKPIRTALFFAGQAKDGSNPYGCPGAPPENRFLYTVSPADPRNLAWSSTPGRPP